MSDTSLNRVEAIIATIKNQLNDSADDKTQKQISRLIGLLPDLASPEHKLLISIAEMAADSLVGSSSNRLLASELIDSIENRLRRERNPILTVVRGGSPAARVVLGLGVVLYVVIPFAIAFWPLYAGIDTILGIDAKMLGLVVVGGALGSCVSIMVRINDFNSIKGADPAVLFLTGFFKPVVGVSFALFMFSVINAGIIPLKFNDSTAQYFFTALSFLSGFSERLARDVVAKTENAIAGAEKKIPQ